MIKQNSRELTTLEYIIMGFVAVKPQSGYALLRRFETGNLRWSASSGSIYPLLKRLEEQSLLTSHLESEHELRPRKVYSLSAAGGDSLDAWLREPPVLRHVIEEYDVALVKFLVMEFRLTPSEIIVWLTTYQTLTQAAHIVHGSINANTDGLSVHERLANRSILLEIEARLTWITDALAHLKGES
jgi:DNA-binding PadR family transcriptional regulator